MAAIRDGSYNDDQPIACECFETGEKWHYVWTRDLSYAAALGLAMLDPARVRNSLEFKLSGYRPGLPKAPAVAGSDDGLQIVQDTGSGGSWPVSTDRVSWAFGADEALNALPLGERKAFALTALKALANTIENDRIAAFDPRDGLYTGEQSFLDWREQSYGADIETDLARMASSKALSTNVAHFKALTLASKLAAEQGDGALAKRYAGWAAQLKSAINARFWLEDAGMYASMTAGHFDGTALRKFDWLGQSLAIVTGVADAGRRDRILAAYPHGPVGAPVIYPQQQGVPVYHNRSIWPFVTAFGLQAAVAGANVSVADAAYDSLVRGASLHLSNMENMEWLSGVPNGPVVNSQRQLWSVGAYVGMVVRNVFGLSFDHADGVRVRPFVTARLRREMFAGGGTISLQQLQVRGKTLRVNIALPAKPVAADGYYAVEAITLNGKKSGPAIGWDQLGGDNVIEVRLGRLVTGKQAIRRVDGDPAAVSGALFAPHEAHIGKAARAARGVEVQIVDARNKGGVHYRLYRNGKLVADRLPAGSWLDAAPAPAANCYAVEVVDAASGNRSHHSGSVCAEPGIEIAADDARVSSSLPLVRDGAARVQGWGAPQDRFVVDRIALATAGRYSFQLRYKNTGHAINTGISNGVKVLLLRDASGREVARRVIQMPHLPPASAPMYSTPADILLKAGTYSVELRDFYNMSYLASNSLYGAGGGKGGALNQVDLYGLRVLALE
ncbi:MAG TPA: esterase [Telluria sp.]